MQRAQTVTTALPATGGADGMPAVVAGVTPIALALSLLLLLL